VHLFGGNCDNISVGGLSAGAYSTVFQLHYDVHRPNPADRLIKRVFLFSNAVGVQPKPSNSPECQAQFDELLTAFNISSDLSSVDKLAALREIPDLQLVSKIQSMRSHTFRAATDNAFISSNFLSSISNGTLTEKLYDQNVSFLSGEVADEYMLYRLVNPPSSYDTLVAQLNNYYPAKVIKAVLGIYTLPSSDADAISWRDIGARIIADCQVHATVRGFASSLLAPPSGHKALPIERVHRYRISWRARGLDEWLDPAVKVCHAADIPIWWGCGKWAGFNPTDLQITRSWLDTFTRFLQGGNEEGEDQWGTENVREIRQLTKDGEIEVVYDEGWERGMQVWNTMLRAQLESPGSFPGIQASL
jgi:carboxylesterase type B